MSIYEDEKKAKWDAAHEKIRSIFAAINKGVIGAGGVIRHGDKKDFDPAGYRPGAHFVFATDADGPKVEVPVEFKAQTSGSMWDSRPNGKINVTVGSYRSNRRFPDRKTGHDIDAIVKEIVHQAKNEKANAINDKRLQKAESDAYERAKAMNVKHGVRFTKSTYAEEDAIAQVPCVRVNRDRELQLHLGDLNEEQIEAVLQFVKKELKL